MPDPQPLEPGDPDRLGSHRILGRIGEGGQGVVYLGETESGERVAVKLFYARLGQDPAARDDFLREIDMARRVARFCTAQVLESGMEGSRPYIASEYVPGPALNQVVAAQGPWTGSALERLAIGTATALVALHDAGVVHRDFKPQNVLIGPDGPRVIDFGIARALGGTSTMTSQVVGTPAYMAPEQLAAGELGFALDVFAWASTIAFAATGRPPFGADAIPAIINRILHQDPDLDGIEPPLRDLLAACLAKDPARRPAAREILDRLVRLRQQPSAEPDASGPPGAPGATPAPDARVVRAARRRQIGAVVVSVLVAVAVTAAVVVTMLPSLRVSALGNGAAVTTRDARSASAVPSPARTAAAGEPGRSRAASPASPGRPKERPAAVRPATQKRTARATPTPTRPAPPASHPTPPSPSPVRQVVGLGPGRFTGYCMSRGWEWAEYRQAPAPGAYCVRRRGDSMYLTQGMRDEGCRWLYRDPRAFHRFTSRASYCYSSL